MLAQFKRFASNPAFIVVFAYALRMGLLYYWWALGPLPINDFLPYGYELGRVASSIAAGHGFSSPLRLVDTGPTVWFTPIYPYFVAGIFKIWGIFTFKSRLVVETTNCAFASLTIFPIYGIARRSFGKAVAVGASWGWVLFPTSLMFPITWIWDTSVAALFMALIFWATVSMKDAKTRLAWAGYGALWATGVLINPSMLSLFPFLAGWAAWRARGDSLPWLRLAAAAGLAFTLFMIPWTVRNYRVFGKFIVLRSNFGLEFWLGNNPDVPDTWSPWLHPDDSREEAEKYRKMGEIAYMAEKNSKALSFIRQHPADTLNFTFRRFLNTWLAVTDSPVDDWSSYPWYFRGFVVLNLLFSIFTWLGVLFARRMKSEYTFAYLTTLLIFPLVFYITHSSARYRFPIDPMMMVLAAYGVAHPISLWIKRIAAQPRAASAAASTASD